MTAADPRLEMLAEMGACAYRLGMAFGAEAERAETTADKLQEPTDNLADRAERDPPEDERAEPLELEPRERLDYTDRDRDREAEAASLPLLLRTLEAVAADAATLPGPPPAALPTLQDLLAQFSSNAGAAPGPGGAPPLRARLAGSVAGQTLTFSPPVPPMVRGGPRLRGATGPPRTTPPKSSPRAKPD
jgi:hypothetical protein